MSSKNSSGRASTGGVGAAADALRQLFVRGDYEGAVQRAEQHLKKRRGALAENNAQRSVIEAAIVAALIHLGKSAEAASRLTALEKLSDVSENVLEFVRFARPYLAWNGQGSVSDALAAVRDLQGKDARKLEAQLLYRLGKYDEAARVYEQLLTDARALLAAKKTPTATSRWTLRVTSNAAPVTAAELETLSQSVTELATNLMATLVLSDKPNDAIAVKDGLESSYELEYNSTCAHIGASDFGMADLCLEKAETMLHELVEGAQGEDDDMEEEMAPVKVQRAYLKHLSGSVVEAKNEYEVIVKNKSADAASLAVAANNLTVALGQLAFDKEVQEMERRKAAESSGHAGSETDGATVEKVASEKKAEKERHDALAEGLKKMRATSGAKVESKLTDQQRRAMARNRSILLVQMGRLDGCKVELDRLKAAYPNDLVNPLIEAALIAKRGNLLAADQVLKSAGDDDTIRAARVQLAEDSGDLLRAAELLIELFPGRPAAVATAATLFEEIGEKDRAISLLRDAANGKDAVEAKKALGDLLLREEKYEEAAEVLEQILKIIPTDSIAQAQLIVATSYFNAERAEELSQRLPPLPAGALDDMTGEELEKLPPPKRRTTAARTRLSGAAAKANGTKAIAENGGEEKKKKRKRKKRLPKNYDPDGPPPDPERWLPKTMRSGYKKKKRRNEVNFRGSQGADAASAEAAAKKNAEKSAARIAAAAESVNEAPVNHRPKGARKKKKNRR